GVDAAILYPPATFRAGAAGYTYLGDIEPYLKDFPFTVWAANTDWAAKNREALLSYIRAYSRAVHWLYDPKNKDQAVDILVRYSKQDRKDSADTYDYFIGKLRAFSANGRISSESYKRMTDALAQWGDLSQPIPPASKFFRFELCRSRLEIATDFVARAAARPAIAVLASDCPPRSITCHSATRIKTAFQLNQSFYCLQD